MPLLVSSERRIGIDDKVLRRLTEYSWPGNIRELDNMIGRAVIQSPEPAITVEDLSGFRLAASPSFQDGTPLKELLLNIEKERIQLAMEECRYRVEGPHGAATKLGMRPETLRSRLKKLGLTS